MKKPLCILIGFGAGNGLALARAFGREGFQIALLSRNPAGQSVHSAALEKEGFTTKSFAADAGSETSLTGALDQVTRELGDASVLIYNAVSPTFGKPTTLASEQLVADFRVNVVGAHIAVRHVLSAMKARGRGTILFTGGGWALQPWDEASSIAIGKAGLRSLTFTLAQELAGTGIHVGTVTIAGQVKAGTKFDPEKIADAFVQLHRQTAGEFDTEIILQ